MTSVRLAPGDQHVLSAHYFDIVIWRIVTDEDQTRIQYQNRILNDKSNLYFDTSPLFLATCRQTRLDRNFSVYGLEDILSEHPKYSKQELTPPSDGFVNAVSIKDDIIAAVSSFSILTLWRTDSEGSEIDFKLFMTFRYLGMKGSRGSSCSIAQDEDWIFCCNSDNAGSEELVIFDKRKAIQDGGGQSDDKSLILRREQGIKDCLPQQQGSKVFLLTQNYSLVAWNL